MTQRRANFARVLASTRASLDDREIDIVLEIAYAMANANGHASFDELDSFRDLAKHLRPGVDVNALLDGFASTLERAGSIEDRVREIAKTLTRPEARAAAYKAAYAIAVFDLETNEDERALDELLIEVLALDTIVDELERQVNEALMGA